MGQVNSVQVEISIVLGRSVLPMQQLLRMGPRNVLIVKDRLREIAGQLGIPAERLPAAQQD